MYGKLASTNNLLAITASNCGLINPFTNKQATASQHHDLLNFRSIGQEFLTNYLLNRTYLQPHQTLYVAGGFDGLVTDTAWYVQGNCQPQPDPEFSYNAEEADTRV